MVQKIIWDNRRSPLFVALIIILLIAVGFLIQVIANNNKINNARIDSEYSGTLLMNDEMTLNLTVNFDGNGKISGTLYYNASLLAFEDASYTCIEDQVRFGILFQEEKLYLSCNGIINYNSTKIDGNLELSNSLGLIIQGSLHLTRN